MGIVETHGASGVPDEESAHTAKLYRDSRNAWARQVARWTTGTES